MRFIKLPLPISFIDVIDEVVSSDQSNILGGIDIEFFQDIFSLIVVGQDCLHTHGATLDDIVSVATSEYAEGKINNIYEREMELFELKLDIFDFGNSDFLGALYSSKELSVKEKFELVCETLKNMVKPSLESKPEKNKLTVPSQQGQSALGFLINANTSNANTSNANTSNANTSNANTSNANTSNANTSNANTSNANTSNANTSNANTSNANTSNANTSNANTSNANTSNANTSNANTSNANTSNANTSNANTSNANTSNANTSNANTSNANTSNANTSNANTSNANTSNANTSNANTSNAEPKTVNIPTSFFWKGLNILLDKLGSQFSYTQEENEKIKNSINSSNRGERVNFCSMYSETMNNKISISQLFKKMIQNKELIIFNIARNIDISFDTTRKGKLVDSEYIASNISIGKMMQMSDIKRARKIDLADSDSFDRKVMNKSIRVDRFKKRKNLKQCIYALLDNSYSTEVEKRTLFIKAVALALGKKAIRDESVFFCRWFNSGVSDLFVLKNKEQWDKFLTFILDRKPNGNTNIDFALKIGIDDIKNNFEGADKSDLIVITDGTEDISDSFVSSFSEHRADNLKLHFLFLEEIKNVKNAKKLAETLHFMDTGKVDINTYVPNFRNVF